LLFALPSEDNRATAQVTCTENLVKFRRVAFEICERTDRRTCRHAGRKYFAPLSEAKLLKARTALNKLSTNGSTHLHTKPETQRQRQKVSKRHRLLRRGGGSETVSTSRDDDNNDDDYFRDSSMRIRSSSSKSDRDNKNNKQTNNNCTEIQVNKSITDAVSVLTVDKSSNQNSRGQHMSPRQSITELNRTV